MTPTKLSDEAKEEWQYRYQERLSILCGGDEPTPEQDAMARAEADATIAMLKARGPQ